MSISSVGSANAAPQTQAPQRTPESAEVSKAGGDGDGDADDGASTVPVKAAAAPAPTINLNGQEIGSIINVTA